MERLEPKLFQRRGSEVLTGGYYRLKSDCKEINNVDGQTIRIKRSIIIFTTWTEKCKIAILTVKSFMFHDVNYEKNTINRVSFLRNAHSNDKNNVFLSTVTELQILFHNAIPHF
jgi:hypothetical protein